MASLTLRLNIDLATLREQRDLLLAEEKARECTKEGDLLEGLVNLVDTIIDEYLQAYPPEDEDA